MNWNQISHLSIAERSALQDQLVKSLFRHQLPYSPFYRQLFKEKNLSFSDFQTTADLAKLPFISKIDLAPTADDAGRPKRFILQPDEALLKQYAPKSLLLKMLSMKASGRSPKPMLEWEYKPIHLHFTTGRSALPTPFAYSARDIETLKESGHRLLEVAGADASLTGLNGFPYSPHLAFWLAYNAMTTIGMTSLQTGGGKIMGTQKIIDALERMKIGLASFIPGYAYHLFREAARQHRDFSSLRYLIFGGDRVSPGLREKVKALARQMGATNLSIQATYAMTEGKTAWIQCNERSGYHTCPDFEFFEVVDTDGRRVGDGESGELVYTALNWRGSLVVRYRTGDMVRGISNEPCPHCGKTVPLIHPDIQRVTEIREFHLTKIKGELINLNEFYPLLSGHPDLEEWQIVLKKRNNDPHDIDEVIITVTPKEGHTPDAIRASVQKMIRDQMVIGVEVEIAPLHELLSRLGMETELKEKRIVDQRPKN
jgi:phenylacetate-coenzyme A ligase PaaK-like adenylate-forming protein